jgi:hypothetical protein
MNRWKLAGAFGLALFVAGCAAPPKGTDGDLDNEWPAMSAPAGWEPQAGVCTDVQGNTMRRTLYQPEDCKEAHSYEFVHIGKLPDSAQPPVKESEAYRKAWSECDTKTTELLGGPWRERKLRIALSLPSTQNWEAGARWVACLALRVRQVNASTPVESSGSLKGAFAAPELQFDCYQVDKSGEYTTKSCTEPHNAEFAGVVDWGGNWDSIEAEWAKEGGGKTHDVCRPVIAAFIGASNVSIGTWAWRSNEEDWEVGDRSLRCFLWLDNVSVSKSMKGVGAKGWPLK